MRLFWALCACVMGQASDVLSTVAFRKLGMREGNPLFQKIVAEKRWGKLIAIKAIMVTAGIFLYAAHRTPPEKRVREIERAAWAGATVSALVGAWNTGWMLYFLWKRRRT